MFELLNKSKGVVFLFIALVCMSNILTARVKQINELEQQATSIAYYEK